MEALVVNKSKGNFDQTAAPRSETASPEFELILTKLDNIFLNTFLTAT